ncbi:MULTISPECIES: hypothetical protein [Pseudofrankia]|uniref:hypothetical protein n=1 Tax=Pseudofrankia TaxID=2994363 RepID=UPI000B23A3C6|nr:MULTISPECIES: hypothetical protein [Pseudofrankia]
MSAGAGERSGRPRDEDGRGGSAATEGTRDRAHGSSQVPPEPGSLAQEAALLAVAVREWLTAHGGDAYPPADVRDPFAPKDAPGPDPDPDPGPGRGAHAGPPWTVGPGETLCTGCPLCRLLSSVAGSHAEVLGHLLAAASSLTAAARAAWPPAGAPGQGTGDQRDERGGPAAWQAFPRQTATQQTRSARDRVQRIDIGE